MTVDGNPGANAAASEAQGRRRGDAARPTIYEALERAVAEAVRDESALVAARARWAALAGTVHDDEPLYEERAAAFLEWFTIERPGDDGRPPIARQLDEAIARNASDEERALLRAVAAAHRGLFLVREPIDEGVLVEDLWGGASFRVTERRRLAGLAPGELFEARLVADPQSPPALVFAKTFCFHPREAESAIRQRLARARASGDDRHVALFQLLRLRVRCERYRHVGAARVYGQDETVT